MIKTMTTDKFEHKAQGWDSPVKIEMAGKFVREMLENFKPEKDFKVLDYGCGTGLAGIEVAPLVKSVVFLDSSRAMLDVLSEKLGSLSDIDSLSPDNSKVIHGDIFKYVTKDVDMVFSLMALHHIEDLESVFEHISRNILKPSGVLVIGDLTDEDGSFHGEEKVAHSGFNIPELARQLEQSDLEVETTYTYNTMKRGGKDYEQFILIARKAEKN
jgi:predicted TPR repeat methyltransferase